MESSTASAVLTSWSWDPWLLVPLAIVCFIYARGARGLVGRIRGFPRWRPRCFAAGVGVLVLASVSPVDSLGHILLWVHMVQHWLIIMCAAPLIVLGAPSVALLRGLPTSIRRDFLGPFLASLLIRRVAALLLHPATGWIAFAATTWIWHYQPLYEAALESQWIHRLEHASFLVGAILFWWQVSAPWPWKSHLPDAAKVVYLLAADVQNTIFSSIVTFAPSVLYPSYAATASALGWTALRDQSVAGAFMWTAGQAVMLPVAVYLVLRALGVVRRKRIDPIDPHSAPRVRATREDRAIGYRVDLLRVAMLGRLLRSRSVRVCLRCALLVLAALVGLDGFTGPQDAPSNLAGTVVWNHWRGLVVCVLLLAGNFLCTSCPMVLARNLLRRFASPKLDWPTRLHTKWIGVGLIVIWLVAYEALDLWSRPLVTAWIIVGYFCAILVVDGLYRGGAFCKWICPVGQLQMFQSLVSPTTLSVRSMATCDQCAGKECIKGAPSGAPRSAHVPLRVAVRGCELELFQPAKKSSFDCTMCMDCVDACPHDNIGLVVNSPRRALARRGWSSSIGSIGSRWDMTALLTLLVFGAFANALGMIAPWLDGIDAMARRYDIASIELLEAGATIATTVLLPTAILLVCGALSRISFSGSLREACGVGAHALVPIGAAMWFAHWFFHGAVSFFTGVPVIQRFAADHGINGLGEPEWSASCCGPVPEWLIPVELLALQAGLLLSGWIAWKACSSRTTRGAVAMAMPWWTLSIVLWALGTWIVLQPMQMRGTLMP